jgi:hypothetical protein
MQNKFCLGINSLGMRSNIKPIYMYYYYVKCVFASNTQKFLVQFLGAITIWLEAIVLSVQNICPNVVLPYMLTFMWESTRDGGQWPTKKIHLHNPRDIIFRMPKIFGQKSKLFSTFIRCLQLLSIIRIPKMPKMPKISKIPQKISKHLRKKSHEYFWA